MSTRKLTKSELPNLVDLHYEVLPNEFLTSISKPFLQEFYSNLYSSGYSHFLGIFEKQKLIGAIVGLEEKYKPKYFSYVLLLLKTMPIFLIKPRKFAQLIQSFFFKLKEPQETEIFFIGVAKNHQGKGFGSILIKALENDLKTKNKHLSVDCKCKLPSNNFYKAYGFKLKKTFKLYNENWNHYEKEIV